MSISHDSFLTKLPCGWKYDRFKDVAVLRNERTDEASEVEDYLELEDLESGTGRILNRRNTMEVISDVTVFKKGDVLFGKLRPYLEKYYVAEFDGKCTGEILAFKPERIASRFLFYCLASSWFIERCNLLAYGTKMPRVNWPTQLAQFNLPLPPLPEQQRIAAFLDASCAAIDAAVSAKHRQLETLDALRSTFIHSLFAELSDAANERVKDIAAKITSGVTPEGGAAGYLDSGIPLLRSQNVHFDGLRLDDVAYISVETHAEMSGSQLKPRDVLLNITGASIGRCSFVPDGFGEGNVNQHVCIIRPGPCIEYRFLAVFLSSPMGQDQINSTFTGASRQGLSHKDLGLIRIPFPKIKIQKEVVAKIEQHDAQHNQLHRCLVSQIETLTAYRKSLIHECVTGQRRITEKDLNKVAAHA
jgi:type I restriction enzyme S subunit